MSAAVAESLRKVRELLAVPERWTQGWLAKTDSGREVSALCPTACSFCLVGATERAVSAADVFDTVEALIRASGADWLALWNDTPGRTHAEVLGLIDRAIAAEASP
jgi:hypothetical protein